MSTRILSLTTFAMLASLSACAAPESDDPEVTAIEEDALLTQPAPGAYTSAKAVNRFPLGSCGFSGSAAQRNSDLNEHNAPYVLSWADEQCVDIQPNPEHCSLARDAAECAKFETNLRKIVFPMDTGAATGCLTPPQLQKLGNTGARTADIGSVYVTDPSDAASPHLTVGHFRIYQYYGNYQYEMVAAQPFVSAAFKAKFPGKTSLAGMRMCFSGYSGNLGLPPGRSPLSCVGFTNASKASQNFGDVAQTSTAYSLYDPTSHRYCPVAFAGEP